MPRTSKIRPKKQKFFDLTTIMDGVGDGVFSKIMSDPEGEEGGEVLAGDMFLMDRKRKPRVGDWVAWMERGTLTVRRYCDADKYAEGKLFGVGVALIRDFRQRLKTRRSRSPKKDPRIAELRDKLSRLECLPENEAVAFQLETQICKLERASTTEEWPDVIGTEGGRDGSI